MTKNNLFSNPHSTIYLLVNTGSNYFFSLDYFDGKITELPIANEIGLYPTFQKLNENYFITIGDSVNIYDIDLSVWYFIGKLSVPRIGSYAIYIENENMIYICGGVNSEGDNTFDIECFNFSITATEVTTTNTELKIKKIKDDFLLRKTFPIIIPLFDYSTFLICGGNNIFKETNTCIVFYTKKDLMYISNINLPKPTFQCNPNVVVYRSSCYFFISDTETVRYSFLQNKFELISKEIIDL